jgi:hypothetical protein
MVYFPIDQKPMNQQPTLTNLDVRGAWSAIAKFHELAWGT